MPDDAGPPQCLHSSTNVFVPITLLALGPAFVVVLWNSRSLTSAVWCNFRHLKVLLFCMGGRRKSMGLHITPFSFQPLSRGCTQQPEALFFFFLVFSLSVLVRSCTPARSRTARCRVSHIHKKEGEKREK